MSEKYLLPVAYCLETGQTVKTQDLTGGRFTLAQRGLALEIAEKYAAKMTARTRREWSGRLIEYSPTVRRDV